MKKFVKILSFILCLLILVTPLLSCKGKTMLKYGDKKLSVNVYEFLLSRMKGTLSYYGYNVEDDSFWRTVISIDGGETYNDYYCEAIKKQAIQYLIADKRFDDLGLKLTDAEEQKIEDIIDGYVKSAGSKSKLNAELKEFGVNYKMLKEIYIIEAKMEKLKEYLYGKNGEKIDLETKEKYFNDNYVAFKQIFVATYDYVTDIDRFGDVVYYTDEKHEAISYDKVNGVTKTNEYGKVIKDILGDPEYFTADGKIAYDRENGVIGYVTNDDGDKEIVSVSDEKKAELFNKAKQYVSDCDGKPYLFEEYIELYDESEDSSLMYLFAEKGYYATQNDYVAYLDDMAETVSRLEVGECAVFKSEYGYHVLCRYENVSGAYDAKETKDLFLGFYDALIISLFDAYCAQYEGDVTINEKVFSKAPTMVDVGVNTKY